MTLIIASLFLPYTVEFQMEDPTESIEALAESLPITVPKQRSSSIHTTQKQSQSFFKSSNYNTANSSVEDFFYNSQQNSPNSSKQYLPTRPILTPRSSDINVLSSGPTTAIELLEKSLSQTTLPLPQQTNPSSSLSATSAGLLNPSAKIYSHLQKSNSSSFIPKSRVTTPPINSVVEKQASKVSSSSTRFEIGLPALKRVHQKSNLKYQNTEDLLVDDKANDKESAPLQLDDDYDSGRDFEIPKFGGFSKTNVLDQQDNIFEKTPFNIVEFPKGNGGLKNAINSSLDDGLLKQVTWLGTVGIPTDELPDSIKLKIENKLRTEFNCESVLPSDFTFQGAYKNFCKQILWPTFHYQIPDNPNSKAFEDHSWDYYRSLNQLFADKIVATYKDGDVIWIHDYHLLLLPEMVRSKLPNAKIGFFLHVSFPSSEVFRCFAQRENLLKGLLGANAISFQTDEYVRHFQQTCNKLLLADISDDEIRYKGTVVKVSYSPVGIDARKLVELQKSADVSDWRNLIREKWASKKLLVGRDKFDRIRGVKQKLLAYEIFLKENPEYIDSTVLIQVCLKSGNTDQTLESEIISIVDRINSLSPNISTTQPVVFLHQDIDFNQYVALISEADLFIVTSMREGMNLTCHEFIVATNKNKSPLILSEFTGSASVFTKGAFLVNPWNIRQVAESYKHALELNNEAKEENWNHLYKVVTKQDAEFWVESSLKFINDSWASQLERQHYTTLKFDEFIKDYNRSQNKLIVINLDRIPNERMMRILNDLSQVNDIYILSSYRRIELERLYRRVPHIGLIAENGGYIRLTNGSWISIVDSQISKNWIESTLKVANSFAERLPGSYVEIDECTLKFHTEQVNDKERKSSTIGDLIAHVNNSTDNEIHATLIRDTVIVQETNLGLKAIKFLLDYLTETGSLNDAKILSPTSPVSLVTTSKSSKKAFVNLPKKLDFLTVAGSSNLILEPILDFANKLNNKIEHVYTIAFGGEISNAKEHVEGLNELFTVLKHLN